MGLRRHIERDIAATKVASPRPPLTYERLPQTVAVRFGGVRRECLVAPVGVERCAHAVDERPGLDLAESRVPLQPLMEGGVGHVRRSQKRRRQAARAMQHPCLGMQLGALGVVSNAYLRAEAGEGVERLGFGYAHVGRGDDSHRAATLDDLFEFIDQRAHTGPDHETHQEVNVSSARELGAQLLADRRLPVPVDQ